MQGGAMESSPGITSLQNPKVKLAVRLRDRRDRDTTQLFLIEGYRELFRARQGSASIETLFFCSDLFLGSNEGALIQSIADTGAQVLTCTAEVFRKLSYRDRPDGLLAIAHQTHRSLGDLQALSAPSKNPFLVVAEAIEKPGNLGTILRSSDAVGLDALLVCDRCTDVFNPNVVRASVGTLFSVPVVECAGMEAFQWLRDHKISILAATPQAKAVYTDVDLTGPVAIAVGTEQLGLSKLWMDGADIQVRIPMCGIADSLNVAMATTLLLYEVLRQRKKIS